MSGQAMTAGQIRVASSWAELVVVAWRRSWQFTGLFRRNSPATMAASRSWTWQWAVVAWQAAAQFPMNLITSGLTAAEIWIDAGSGSACIQRLPHRRRCTAPGLLLALCTALVLAAVMLALLVLGMLTSGVVMLVAVVSVLLVWLVGLALNLARPQPEGLRRRAGELTDRPAVVLTAVVVGKQLRGDGLRLMRSMADRWTRDGVAVAVLYAGSDDLVRFYRDMVGGWILDAGSTRRMIWTGGNR